MKKTSLLALAALAAAGAAQAQEVGRVVSSTPVIQQVAVPRTVCNNQPMAVEQPTSGAGGVIGALAGGALGSTIGHGSGTGAAIALGAIGGAILGNNVERGNTTVQNVQQCSTQTFYENRATSYNVVYEFAGRQYQVNMPNDPGPTVKLQVTPVGAQPPVATAPQAAVPQAVVPQAYAAPVVTAPVVVTPQVVYPAYYYRPYYYPPVSLSFGYVHHHHRRWR